MYLAAQPASPTSKQLIDRHVRIGRHRILKQDCEFGIAQIVEIAIRALSPAVNDTFTGVGCVDWVTDALLSIADVSLSDGCWYDTAARCGCASLRFGSSAW